MLTITPEIAQKSYEAFLAEERMEPKYDAVNHPKHYKNHPSGIEPIEVTRHLGFDLGNMFKYTVRFRDKGTPEQDLRKAIYYAKDHLSHNTYQRLQLSPEVRDNLMRFIVAEKNPYIRSAWYSLLRLSENDIIVETVMNSMIEALESAVADPQCVSADNIISQFRNVY